VTGAEHRSVVVEADGGSRGNPGPAAYGAVLKDADTGRVVAERGERIGVATNNVAEYRGLIAGLELYREHADGAALEVRMDSRLVVEQMSGRWRIKHPDMRPLAVQANRLAPDGTRYTWVPRERNKEADRLVNQALDGPEGVVVTGRADPGPTAEVGGHPSADTAVAGQPPVPGPPEGPPTTFVLVRHGETEDTRARVFSGRAGADPGLNDDGRAQVRATGEWLTPLADLAPALLVSPLRRARDSAEIVGEFLGVTPVVDDGLLEAGFGAWEGLTYAEVMARDPQAFATWFDDFDQPAGGTGDSLTGMARRMEKTRDRLLEAYRGQTVVAVSHLTPIKLLLASALDLPLTSLFRTEIAPASVSVVAWYADGRAVVRLLNGRADVFTHGLPD
jgi:probable phosphoglycerate mutase